MQTYLQSGKPIISACDGAVMDLIDEAKCGYCVNSGDYKGLASAIIKMSHNDETEIKHFSENAKTYATTHFDKKTFFDKLENELALLKK
jgi:colanic acid biosynthesis glycosyl transferase WcaI